MTWLSNSAVTLSITCTLAQAESIKSLTENQTWWHIFFYFDRATQFAWCLRFEATETIEKLSFLAKIWIVVEIPIIKFGTSWNSSRQHTSQIEGREAWSTAYIKYQQTFMVFINHDLGFRPQQDASLDAGVLVPIYVRKFRNRSLIRTYTQNAFSKIDLKWKKAS